MNSIQLSGLQAISPLVSAMLASSRNNTHRENCFYAVATGKVRGIFASAQDFHIATLNNCETPTPQIFSRIEDAIAYMGWGSEPNHPLKRFDPSSLISTQEFGDTKVSVPPVNPFAGIKIHHADSQSVGFLHSNQRLGQALGRYNLARSADIQLDNSSQTQESDTSSDDQISQNSVALDTHTYTTRRRDNTVESRKSPGEEVSNKTAKEFDRHYVKHDYHDFVNVNENDIATQVTTKVNKNGKQARSGPRGGVVSPFPGKLHEMLENAEAENHDHIVSWRPHGRAFIIHKPKEFERVIMPKYFKTQTKHTSLQRQLNLYGFTRLSTGPDAGSYYHELFLRGKAFLTKKMVRTKVKGWRVKPAASPNTEPKLYSYPFAPASVSTLALRHKTNDPNFTQKDDPTNDTENIDQVNVLNKPISSSSSRHPSLLLLANVMQNI